MKKNECNYCKKYPGEPCLVCGSLSHDSNNTETFHSTLYAAEFLLYAFHFGSCDRNSDSEKAPAHPFRILVAEG